jgi:hypothetical protein
MLDQYSKKPLYSFHSGLIRHRHTHTIYNKHSISWDNNLTISGYCPKRHKAHIQTLGLSKSYSGHGMAAYNRLGHFYLRLSTTVKRSSLECLSTIRYNVSGIKHTLSLFCRLYLFIDN